MSKCITIKQAQAYLSRIQTWSVRRKPDKKERGRLIARAIQEVEDLREERREKERQFFIAKSPLPQKICPCVTCPPLSIKRNITKGAGIIGRKKKKEKMGVGHKDT